MLYIPALQLVHVVGLVVAEPRPAVQMRQIPPIVLVLVLVLVLVRVLVCSMRKPGGHGGRQKTAA